jgi:hypothetical protein
MNKWQRMSNGIAYYKTLILALLNDDRSPITITRSEILTIHDPDDFDLPDSRKD